MNIIDAADILREDENEDIGEEDEEEEVDEEEGDQEPKRRRGKDRVWNQIGSFANMDQWKGSDICADVTNEMTRNTQHDTFDYHFDVFVCHYSRKHGWKPCPRIVRVGFSTTSQEIVVWENEGGHHQLKLKFLLQGMYGPSGQMSLERYKCKMLGRTTTRKRRKSMTKG